MIVRSEGIAKALRVLVEDSAKMADIPIQKAFAMQTRFIRNNPETYSEKEFGELSYYFKAVGYKFHLTNIHLEQMWALREHNTYTVESVIANALDWLNTTDPELLAITFALEGFLLQARTFLDFYMIYLCKFLKTGFEGSMSTQRFYENLNRVQSGPFMSKARLVDQYFRSKVFSHSESSGLAYDEWGTLLCSLRDKIAHRDRIRPTFTGIETLTGEVLVEWPTLRGSTYEILCQHLETGMFCLLQDVSPLIYDLEWPALSTDVR